MKKSCFFCILYLLLAVFTGCGDAASPGGSAQGSLPGSGLESVERPEAGESPDNSSGSEGSPADRELEASAQGTDSRDDSVSNPDETDSPAGNGESGTARTTLSGFTGTMSCMGSGRLLLTVKDKILLLDGGTLEIQKEAENSAPNLINIQTLAMEDGCRMLGATFEGQSFQLIEYDGELQVKQITDLEEASATERMIFSCRLLSDGNRILYNDIDGFYLFDLLSGEKKDLTQEGIFIYYFACLEEKGEILFSGSDASGKRILGKMNMDGEGLQIEDREHLWGELWTFGEYALAGEAELVGKEKEGVVLRYDAQGIHAFPLTDSGENGNITVSCGGAYYGTRTRLVGDVLRYCVRIYSSEDGSLVKELPLSYEEYGDNFRLSGYLICDDMQKIILYGYWRGREEDTWIVTMDL